jgi:hypothetical protein
MLGFDSLLALEISSCSGLALNYVNGKTYTQENGERSNLHLMLDDRLKQLDADCRSMRSKNIRILWIWIWIRNTALGD